ncbi:hypothetical protein [Serinicoccus marinus]|uniref:hypothetical protein n=1 Tax=Serinicoccus marinus TaxID=247333 RepID=UPI00122E672F|nr:hypothetical protein [Serinicoccus marinus]
MTLLQEDGSRKPYRPPAEAYLKAQANRRGKAAAEAHRYFKVSNALWTRGHLQVLSGPALVMLLILLSEQGGEGKPVWFSTSVFDARYGISSRTRAAGVRELVERGLLVVERASLPTRPGGSAFDRQRYRDVYHLTGAALVDDKARAASQAWKDSAKLAGAPLPRADAIDELLGR